MKTKAFYMKLFSLALVLGLFAAGCQMEPEEEAGLPSTKGQFKLTTLPETANGKYAYINNSYPAEEGTVLLGLTGVGSENRLKGAKIKNGIVEIPLYLHNGKAIKAYKGTENLALIIYVSDEEARTQEELRAVTQIRFMAVEFKSGKASKDYVAATDKVGTIY